MSEASKEERKEQPWWAIDKEAWRRKFSTVVKLQSSMKEDEKALPAWTSKDIEAFAKEDPVYGPQVAALRKNSEACGYGAVAGAVGSAGVALRFSKSPHGAVLAGLLGGLTGWLVTNEGATWAYGTYKFDNMDANLKFVEWWRKKSSS
eukprot:TRINITY_DN17343_c0_g1_i1.p1 TRINITY_DN17343_c0_g1~~TRINITY_DN17343_c0_g1_i1.p1  ORF type:complete len:148 (-),score=17.67 TRINITY_DN17343_c0_g1_i1:225-668(-)